jgi:hypothetical protein
VWRELGKFAGVPPPSFEIVRRMVRAAPPNRFGGSVVSLGAKEIEGRKAVGFLIRPSSGAIVLWADPQTALPMRIEMNIGQGQWVMDTFRYDVDLNRSLFSLEPPPGYTVKVNPGLPTEVDLTRFLRIVAEHNSGRFPAVIPWNEQVSVALQGVISEHKKTVAKYGKDSPEVKVAGSQVEKLAQGLKFCGSLKRENDSHYTGGGVKLGTPDRPILRYKPTGSEKYHVIYADLSIKELTADEAKALTQESSK